MEKQNRDFGSGYLDSSAMMHVILVSNNIYSMKLTEYFCLWLYLNIALFTTQ